MRVGRQLAPKVFCLCVIISPPRPAGSQLACSCFKLVRFAGLLLSDLSVLTRGHWLNLCGVVIMQVYITYIYIYTEYFCAPPEGLQGRELLGLSSYEITHARARVSGYMGPKWATGPSKLDTWVCIPGYLGPTCASGPSKLDTRARVSGYMGPKWAPGPSKLGTWPRVSGYMGPKCTSGPSKLRNSCPDMKSHAPRGLVEPPPTSQKVSCKGLNKHIGKSTSTDTNINTNTHTNTIQH